MPADPMLYFYLLLGQQYVTNDIEYMKPYKPHTTSVMISNKDMYDVKKLMDDILIKEIKQEEKR